ncbi:MAG TPA: hypothetical protein VGC27_11220, partial [Rhizomicrobium sp.]
VVQSFIRQSGDEIAKYGSGHRRDPTRQQHFATGSESTHMSLSITVKDRHPPPLCMTAYEHEVIGLCAGLSFTVSKYPLTYPQTENRQLGRNRLRLRE